MYAIFISDHESSVGPPLIDSNDSDKKKVSWNEDSQQTAVATKAVPEFERHSSTDRPSTSDSQNPVEGERSEIWQFHTVVAALPTAKKNKYVH